MKRKAVTEVLPGALQAMLGLEKFIRASSLDRKLAELVKIRASQLNGCAYCIDMHTEEALELGETNRRLFAVAAWHESPLFTDEEKIALRLAEEVTLIGEEGLTDETYEAAIGAFGEETTALLIFQTITINMWNRSAVSGHQVYKSKHDK